MPDIYERRKLIEEAVRDLHVFDRKVEGGDGMWHKPDRNEPDYYRYVRDEEPRYDLWLETGVDRQGMDIHVSATVKVYNVEREFALPEFEETVFDKVFVGDQPSERMFLNNVPRYQEKINEAVTERVEWIVSRVEDMRHEADGEVVYEA